MKPQQYAPARYNYSCSGFAPLAGFEVTTYGRFASYPPQPSLVFRLRGYRYRRAVGDLVSR